MPAPERDQGVHRLLADLLYSPSNKTIAVIPEGDRFSAMALALADLASRGLVVGSWRMASASRGTRVLVYRTTPAGRTLGKRLRWQISDLYLAAVGRCAVVMGGPVPCGRLTTSPADAGSGASGGTLGSATRSRGSFAPSRAGTARRRF